MRLVSCRPGIIWLREEAPTGAEQNHVLHFLPTTCVIIVVGCFLDCLLWTISQQLWKAPLCPLHSLVEFPHSFRTMVNTTEDIFNSQCDIPSSPLTQYPSGSSLPAGSIHVSSKCDNLSECSEEDYFEDKIQRLLRKAITTVHITFCLVTLSLWWMVHPQVISHPDIL